MSSAAAAVDASSSPVMDAVGFVLIAGAIITGLTITVLRMVRATRPREKQMARLATQLDGRSQVCVRTEEIGLCREDLLRVAYSRGYSLIEHRFGKYYEFVFTPHQPGRSAPWAI